MIIINYLLLIIFCLVIINVTLYHFGYLDELEEELHDKFDVDNENRRRDN